MNAKELAELLNGRQYWDEITDNEAATAKEHGLVVVFGASDDLMELRGAVYDELGCYEGGDAYLDSNGALFNKCDCEDCPYFQEKLAGAKTITALWNTGGYSWVYKTDIAHETFDIFDDKEPYCRGIVFSLKDIS